MDFEGNLIKNDFFLLLNGSRYDSDGEGIHHDWVTFACLSPVSQEDNGNDMIYGQLIISEVEFP